MRLPPPQSEEEGPNLTPVIDVVFLLLIFFLVATRFDQEEREISTRLAKVPEASPLSMPPGEIIINVSKEGEYIVVGQKLSQQQLDSYLAELYRKNPTTQKVQIRADDRVQFRFPATVMGLCEQHKIDHYCTVIQEVAAK